MKLRSIASLCVLVAMLPLLAGIGPCPLGGGSPFGNPFNNWASTVLFDGLMDFNNVWDANAQSYNNALGTLQTGLTEYQNTVNTINAQNIESVNNHVISQQAIAERDRAMALAAEHRRMAEWAASERRP
ncbi:hypothetical protein ACFLW1_00775 [Chloroflexota bacterium]